MTPANIIIAILAGMVVGSVYVVAVIVRTEWRAGRKDKP